MKIQIRLLDLTTMKEFTKEFATEFERDKFIRKLKYSKKTYCFNKTRRIRFLVNCILFVLILCI